ncbi:MAG: hypothetical protein AB7I30_06300 [Isosphaeraceae bacterium]
MATISSRPQPRPFAPTLRRQMILVAYFGLLFAATASWARRSGPDPRVVGMALLVSPWLLGGLIAVFDERGPLRNWAALFAFGLFYPAMAVALDVSVAVNAWSAGSTPRLGGLILFNALVGCSTYVFLRRMAPSRCPSCERRAVIPLLRLRGQTVRLKWTHWCGACLRRYWRDARGAWNEERRQTWADQVAAPPSDDPTSRSPARGEVEERSVAPV